MREIDKMAVSAASDERLLNDLIQSNRAFILRCASRAARRYVTQSDDEWSLALFAFHEAVRSYDLDKGSFLRFSELVIRRRLADYYKSQAKYAQEISVSPRVFDAEPEEEGEDLSLRLTITEKVAVSEDTSLKDEIDAANQLFRQYGFSFFDLAECSPKAGKTKAACTKAVAYLLHTPPLISEMQRTRLLPVKILEDRCGIPRKILERHRKYIIAAAESLSGEYPCLAEYLDGIRKELKNP